MLFMGRGFTFGGQKLGCVFSAVVCKTQARKRYIEYLPLVPKDKRSCFSQGERFTVRLPLETTHKLLMHSKKFLATLLQTSATRVVG